jgi:hypothetical protein
VVLGALFILVCGAALVFDSFGAGWWPGDLSLTELNRWRG